MLDDCKMWNFFHLKQQSKFNDDDKGTISPRSIAMPHSKRIWESTNWWNFYLANFASQLFFFNSHFVLFSLNFKQFKKFFQSRMSWEHEIFQFSWLFVLRICSIIYFLHQWFSRALALREMSRKGQHVEVACGRISCDVSSEELLMINKEQRIFYFEG